MIEIRDATVQDWVSFYGDQPQHTFRAVVGVLEGEIVGMGGVMYEAVPKAFMTLTEEGAKHPREIIRGTRKVLQSMARNHKIVFAIEENDTVARRFLVHFGFEPIGNGVFRWLIR